MSESSDFSRAVVAAYERMPLWQRDQFDASMRDAIEQINKIAAWMKRNPEIVAALTDTEGESA